MSALHGSPWHTHTFTIYTQELVDKLHKNDLPVHDEIVHTEELTKERTMSANSTAKWKHLSFMCEIWAFFFFLIQMRVGRQVHIPMLLTMKFSSIHSVRLMFAANCFCIYIYIYMFVGSVLYSIFQHIFLPNFNHFAHVCITLRTTCSHHNQQSVNTIDFINDILSAI